MAIEKVHMYQNTSIMQVSYHTLYVKVSMDNKVSLRGVVVRLPDSLVIEETQWIQSPDLNTEKDRKNGTDQELLQII